MTRPSSKALLIFQALHFATLSLPLNSMSESLIVCRLTTNLNIISYFLYSRCVVLFSEIPYLHFLYPVLHKFLHHTFFYLNMAALNLRISNSMHAYKTRLYLIR